MLSRLGRCFGLSKRSFGWIDDFLQSDFYDNVFTESEVSWEKTKKGFDQMRERYPNSKKILNTYCRMACFAGDRELAQKLFMEIGNDRVAGAWMKNEFSRAKAWANP